MNTETEILVWVIGQIVTAAAIFGGIRADLKNIHHNIKLALDAANAAHGRIDRHLEHNNHGV